MLGDRGLVDLGRGFLDMVTRVLLETGLDPLVRSEAMRNRRYDSFESRNQRRKLLISDTLPSR